MRDDIVGMLRNAMERGGNPNRIAQSLINSGYPLHDVQEALTYVTGNTQQQNQNQTPPQANQPVQQGQIPLPAIPQWQTAAQNPMAPKYAMQHVQPTNQKLSPLKPFSGKKPRKPGTIKLVVMFSILILLIFALVGVIVFKDQILDLLG